MGDFSPIFLFLMMTPSRELLDRCCKDDRKAHYELYTLCFSFLLSVCRRYYINREDMVSSLNMVFVKVVKNISSYTKKRDQVPFDLWVRKITVNYIVDEFRKNKKYKESIDYREIQDAEEIHPIVLPDFANGQMQEINEAISKLPLMSKAVFNLFVIDGYKHEEISSMLNISQGTSKAHLFKAKKRLRELLEVKASNGQGIQNAVAQ